MICAFSGEQAKEPVLSPKSGAIFEKRLIESYISTAGKDPINNESLTADELIPIKESLPVVSPIQPPQFNSIPTLLQAFQEQWDALALETFSLRKELRVAKQELSTALYQYDAAVKVAATAMKERDEAQEALRQLSESFASGVDKSAADEEDGADEESQRVDGTKEEETKEQPSSERRPIPVKELQQARETLFNLHKKEKYSLQLTKSSEVQVNEASTKHDVANIQKVTLPSKENSMVLISSELLQIYPGLEQYQAKDASDAVLGSEDSLLVAEGSVVRNTSTGEILELNSNIQFLKSHPSLPLFIAITDDNTWSLCDTKGVLHKSEALPAALSTDIHMDGVLFGVGTQTGEVRIYDISNTQQVSLVSTKYQEVTKLQFAQNGYWLGVSSIDSESGSAAVQIIDLRKNSLVHELLFDSRTDFSIDPSCQVLITNELKSGSLNLHFYIKKGKQWADNAHQISTAEDTKEVVCIAKKESYSKNSITALAVNASALIEYTVSFQ